LLSKTDRTCQFTSSTKELKVHENEKLRKNDDNNFDNESDSPGNKPIMG